MVSQRVSMPPRGRPILLTEIETEDGLRMAAKTVLLVDRECPLNTLVVVTFAYGMPDAAGRHEGPRAARLAWWEIGRRFSVRAEPSEWIACDEDRLLVRGRDVGRARGGGPLDAAFMHLWTVRDGTIVALEQLTDTALWASA